MAMEITNNYIYNTIQDMKKNHAAESTQKETEQAAKEPANSGADKAQTWQSSIPIAYRIKSRILRITSANWRSLRQACL